MYVLEKTFLSCETCVLSNCFLLNNKICLKIKVILTHIHTPPIMVDRQKDRDSLCSDSHFLYNYQMYVAECSIVL